ncbi:MAG: CBS domain-containing protein [Bacteroidetes bacterium]|nr:CBS domain-containing protein [Bacteroidota bacterium]
MKLKDIIKVKGSTVFSIDPEKSVKDAVDMLITYNIGSLLVMENAHPIGIFTERDILRVVVSSADRLSEIPVREVMSRNLIISQLEDEVSVAMHVMTTKRIRHLPVLAEDRIAGMVSIGDLVKSQHDEKDITIRYLKDYITGNDMR